MVSFGVRLLGCLGLDRFKFLNRGSHGQDSVRGRQRSVGFERCRRSPVFEGSLPLPPAGPSAVLFT